VERGSRTMENPIIEWREWARFPALPEKERGAAEN